MRRVALVRWGWLSGALLLMAMAGCTAPRPAVDDVSTVGSHEVIVVGRIELTPSLTDEDQILKGIGTGKFKNKVFVITNEEWQDKQGGIELGDDFFEATLGEPFYIKGSNKPFYFLTGVIYTEVSSKGAMQNVNLPGGVKIELRSNDKAVYVGTIRYTRNEYFDITRAEINDDYDRANAAFKKKFGVKYNLRKVLAAPIKVKNNG
jgi:hypothetical protein